MLHIFKRDHTYHLERGIPLKIGNKKRRGYSKNGDGNKKKTHLKLKKKNSFKLRKKINNNFLQKLAPRTTNRM